MRGLKTIYAFETTEALRHALDCWVAEAGPASLDTEVVCWNDNHHTI